MNKIPSVHLAKEILGPENVIDKAISARIFQIGWVYRFFAILFFWIPFSKERLEACKGTHKLIFVFPLSIREMSRAFYGWVTQTDRHSRILDEKILDNLENMKMGWHLIRIRPIEKQDMINYKSEKPVNGFIVYYTILACFAHRGDVILKDQLVECPDFKNGLKRFNVGFFRPFSSAGIRIEEAWEKFSVDWVLLEYVPNCKELSK